MVLLPRPPVVLDILEEHLSELDFLWEQRERVIFAPDWTIHELMSLEERAEAHLDGLTIGGGHSLDLARPFLMGERPGGAIASVFVMMAFGERELAEEVLSTLRSGAPEACEGVRIGLRHNDITPILDGLVTVASNGDPIARSSAADVLSFHRCAVQLRLTELFAHPEAPVRRLAYQAVGRFGGPWGDDYLVDALDDESPDVRWEALVASARIGLPRIADICRWAVARKPYPVPEAIQFLGILGDPEDLGLLQSAASTPEAATCALKGIGAMGQIAAVPFLIEAMKDPARAQASGQAFTQITGAARISADAPMTPPADLAEHETDSRSEQPPPDPERALDWWKNEKSRFATGVRWQAGRSISTAPLSEALTFLPLESRRDLYLSQRARSPSAIPDLELERRARLQM